MIRSHNTNKLHKCVLCDYNCERKSKFYHLFTEHLLVRNVVRTSHQRYLCRQLVARSIDMSSSCLRKRGWPSASHGSFRWIPPETSLCCYVALSCYWARPPQLTVSTTFRSLSVKAESSAEAESIDKASKSCVAVFGSWSRSRDFHGSCCINLSIFNRMTLTVGQIVTPGKSISQTGWLVDSSEVMVGLI